MNRPRAELTTRLLNRLGAGDRAAEEEILAAVYDELYSLASRSLGRQERDVTLQPTALLHEAWLRMVDQDSLEFDARGQFYRLASRVMRSVLVDYFRARNAQKRGGDRREPLTLTSAQPSEPPPSIDVLAVDEALRKLEAFDLELCRIVEMRFFAGLSHPDIAGATGLPLRTVERRWRQARAWLQAELDS
jgi:RNA polymerase sigma factor (TIGR02999 family)